MKHCEQKLSTYVYNNCNICNILIYLCNIHTEHLQHTYETFETLETYVCNMPFQRNISLLLVNRGLSTRRVHWCRARGWTELAAPVEKAAAGLVEKAPVYGRRNGEGGRSAAMLECGGDVGWRSRIAMEREAWWTARSPRRHGGARSWSAVVALR
jgi:hypothetical protein